jgi:hypothetical protein
MPPNGKQSLELQHDRDALLPNFNFLHKPRGNWGKKIACHKETRGAFSRMFISGVRKGKRLRTRSVKHSGYSSPQILMIAN